ncbi:MAG: DUF2608 domain-containing protein [Chlamydiota bacterium]
MNKIFRCLTITFCFFAAYVQAEIIEADSIHDIRHHIDPETLVIFDIDNTLMEPAQTLGSDQWFYHRIGEYKAKGMDQQVALEQSLSEWMSVQSITKVKIVEEGTAELIKRLQNEGYTLMGLTTRGLGLSTRTIFQLDSLHINLSVTAPTQEEVFFMNNHGVLFRGGILFTAGSHKGVALAKFLHLIEKTPNNIVFINDKWSNIREVEVICEKYQVPFTGLRYNYVDGKVANFNQDIADLQWEEFGKILSDEDAEKRLLKVRTES